MLPFFTEPLYNLTMTKIIEKKYENTILYLCVKLGGSLSGKKRLAKLLYYIDFDRYEFNESAKTITGDVYQAWKMGPVPKQYTNVIERMRINGSLDVSQVESIDGYYPAEVYKAKQQPDLSVFDKDDIRIIDHVIGKYGRLSGKQLEDLTHVEAPYVGTKPNDEIVYELAFYRGTDFSDVMATT